MAITYKYTGVLKRVIDGDTIDVVVDLGFSIFTVVRFRLYGIDTPEINSPNPELRKLATGAKEFVEKHIGVNAIHIESFGRDKYGRYLGVFHVDVDSASINEQLVSLGLAKKYFGDGKTITLW